VGSETVRGPVSNTLLECVTPPGSGADNDVTVEASPGSTDSPHNARRTVGWTATVATDAAAVSCIDDNSRGFAFGAHDFVWGLALARTSAVNVLLGASASIQTDATLPVRPLAVAVDPSTLDVFLLAAMEAATSNPFVLTAPQFVKNVDPAPTVQCQSAKICTLLVRATRLGKTVWATKIDAAATHVSGQALVIDAGETDGGVYIAGSVEGGTGTATLYSVDPVTRGPSATTVAASAAGSNTAGAVDLFVAKFSGSGAALWGRVVQSSSGAKFKPRIGLATFRAANSDTINTHLKGDNPSGNYIDGRLTQTGGVYASFSVVVATATTSVTFGDLPPAYTTAPYAVATTSVAYTYPATCTAAGVLRLDRNGFAYWVRHVFKKVATGSPSGDAQATSISVRAPIFSSMTSDLAGLW
jgi:hypothetical protein